MSVKLLSAILGPEMGASILWTPGKMRSFCRKNNVHKIPLFREGGIFGFFLGGGRADFIFMGARIFLRFCVAMPQTAESNRSQQLPVGSCACKAAGKSALAEVPLKPHFVTSHFIPT